MKTANGCNDSKFVLITISLTYVLKLLVCDFTSDVTNYARLFISIIITETKQIVRVFGYVCVLVWTTFILTKKLSPYSFCFCILLENKIRNYYWTHFKWDTLWLFQQNAMQLQWIVFKVYSILIKIFSLIKFYHARENIFRLHPKG